MLCYRKGQLEEKRFYDLPELVLPGSLLVFNETRVIHARIMVLNKNGAWIEVFLLEPVSPHPEMSLALRQQGSCIWRCYVGNAKKWKDEILVPKSGSPAMELVSRDEAFYYVRFEWKEPVPFGALLHSAGQIPLPPYMKREAGQEDETRYQTVFAREEGSVAAPTASLHFTEPVLDGLKARHIETASVVLHVGAGTFTPVKTETLGEHEMHEEKISVPLVTIRKLIQHPHIIAAGTTSLRTLESLYWMGKKILLEKEPTDLVTDQWMPYDYHPEFTPTREESLQALAGWMERRGMERLDAATRLLIVPGYEFRVVNTLITNFHQPGSTLLLLVAAFLGEAWKTVYDYALTHEFRFLSYGDASLLSR